MSTKMCNHHAHVGPNELPVTEFHKDSHAHDGLCSLCKVCARRKANARRRELSKDPEWRKHFNALNTKSRKAAGKVGQLFEAAKQRARKSGLEFTITRDDIVIPEFCPVLGIPIIAGSGRKWDEKSTESNKLVGALDTSPSIDRIDNSKGYVPGNIMVISWRANYLKNNASFDELILLGEHARKMKSQLENDNKKGENVDSVEGV